MYVDLCIIAGAAWAQPSNSRMLLSCRELMRFKLLDTQCPCYHNTPGRRGVARIPNVRSDYIERSDVYHRLGTSLKAVLGCQAWGHGFACMRSDVNSMKLSF